VRRLLPPASGDASFGIDWLPRLISGGDQGVPLVNVTRKKLDMEGPIRHRQG
jgi:hypothetical protein